VVGATLSRWTMSYFAAALACLVGAEILMAAGFGFPGLAIGAPETLLLVHLVAIGWLSLLMLGALFQFVPVLIAKPIYSNALPLPTLLLLLIGLTALLLGFLQLAGRISGAFPYFPAAAVFLGLGFALALWNLGRTLWPARPLPLPAQFVSVGLVCVGATVTLGIIFALVLHGAIARPALVDLTAFGVPVHAAAGLAGWLTFTAMGVSYRLLAMFMLAPEEKRRSSLVALWGGIVVLLLAIVGGCVAIFLGRDPAPVLAIAALLAVPVLALYGFDVVHLYQRRKRRRLETNSLMAAPALASLGLAAALIVVLLALGALPRFAGAVVYLVGFGWLSGLGLAQLYKIVAFVTWLECYGPVLGKAPTPRVQDLVVEKRARKWFYLYFAAVWVSTLALCLDQPLAFRGLALLLLVATIGLIAELIRARRLVDVTAAVRLPAGAQRPRLLMALSPQN